MGKSKIVIVQFISCVIPYFSTHFIFLISMFRLRRLKAPVYCWIGFWGILLSLFLYGCFVSQAFSETRPILMHILAIPAFSAANIGMILTQKKAEQRAQKNAEDKSLESEPVVAGDTSNNN